MYGRPIISADQPQFMRTTYRCDNRKCCDDAVQPTEDDGFDVSENGNGRAEVEKILKPYSTWIIILN